MPTVVPVFRRKKYKEDQQMRRSLRCPKKSTKLATAVQGRNAGTFSRWLAYAVDKGLTIAFAFLLILIVSSLYNLIPGDSITEEAAALVSDENWEAGLDGNATDVERAQAAAEEESEEEKKIFLLSVGLPVIVVNLIAFVVDALSMAAIGRTVGKAFMGLVVVNSWNGKVGHITVCQAIYRSFLSNILTFLVWMGAFVSLAREDRRGIIDLLCGTTVIYAWDAKSYRMASDELAKESPFGGLDFDALDFDDPDEMESQGGSLVGSPTLTKRKRDSGIHNRSSVKTRVVDIPM